MPRENRSTGRNAADMCARSTTRRLRGRRARRKPRQLSGADACGAVRAARRWHPVETRTHRSSTTERGRPDTALAASGDRCLPIVDASAGTRTRTRGRLTEAMDARSDACRAAGASRRSSGAQSQWRTTESGASLCRKLGEGTLSGSRAIPRAVRMLEFERLHRNGRRSTTDRSRAASLPGRDRKEVARPSRGEWRCRPHQGRPAATARGRHLHPELGAGESCIADFGATL